MSPETAAANRVERNAALVEVMLLAAMADGKLTEGSIQALLRRVLERPEFDGTAPEEISTTASLVEHSPSTVIALKLTATAGRRSSIASPGSSG